MPTICNLTTKVKRLILKIKYFFDSICCTGNIFLVCFIKTEAICIHLVITIYIEKKLIKITLKHHDKYNKDKHMYIGKHFLFTKI